MTKILDVLGILVPNSCHMNLWRQTPVKILPRSLISRVFSDIHKPVEVDKTATKQGVHQCQYKVT
jgi:hypothetical protein